MRKGIALPLETVVLLILAVIVLGALLAFFLGAFTPAQTETDLIRKQTGVCQEIAAAGCTTSQAETIAQQKLRGTEEICRADRPACNGETARECISSCCRIFCG